MALLNTNIGPERAQVFDVPLGTVQVPGAAISIAAFMVSTKLASAPVNTPTTVRSMDEFTTSFGDADDVTQGYYEVQGYFDNAGTGNQAIIVNVGDGANASGTVTITSFADLLETAADTVEVAGITFTAQAGAATPGDATFQAATDNNTTAQSLADQINANTSTSASVTASAAGAVVTVTAKVGGTAGNAFTLAYTDNGSVVGATVSGATLTGGAAPTAADYVGNEALGTGLRALDTIDNVGLIVAPDLDLARKYLVDAAVIDYSETVRSEFGSTLSTSFSLLAIPKEVTKASSSVLVASATVAGAPAGLVVTVDDGAAGPVDLSAVTAGMVVKKAGTLIGTVTAVDDGANTLTLTTVGTLADNDAITVETPSAIEYKDSVINNPSRFAAWYFNNFNVLDQSANAAAGALVQTGPAGHVAGVYARIDANRAIGGPSHAPSGIQFAGIAGISGLTLTLSERLDAEPLRLAFINRITSFVGQGNVIFGGYTAGGSAVTADEQLIQVMRSLIFVKVSLEPGLRGFIWENFSPDTQSRIAQAIQSFLRNNSHLFPTGLPETSQFRVISVEPTQNELDQGLLRVRVQLRPNKAVRFIEIALEFPIPAA